ncbi:MAG: hypothetical protein B6U76_04725 [Desulfurococcales archaeon ex4484_217_2]|nr:MAG: hypothetical protein B6U76_04725 [Desulfurococcales archaeon ex4484_217_2]
MDVITTILFGPNRGINVLNLDWDHLIILDACRCDIFKHVYKEFFPSDAEFKCVISPASSTMEFVRKNLDDNIKEKLKNTLFVNSNPVIDHILGARLEMLFHKYIPVWREHWDSKIGTVRPEVTYYVALRTYVRNPGKRMIIWFLQPHYPYLNEKFAHINVLGKEQHNRNISSILRSILYKIPEKDKNIEKVIVLTALIKSIVKLGCLFLGGPSKLGVYMRRNTHEVIRAYISNLIKVLYYVKKLAEVLPGKIVITSDHGEAFGEPLSKLLPLRVYGHPSRIRISSLTQVPYLVVENKISQHEAIRKAFRHLTHLFTARTRCSEVQ